MPSSERPDSNPAPIDSSVDPPDVSAVSRRDKSSEDVARLYDDVADSLARWNWADRLFSGRYRRRQFGDARGRVLDVACGTGTNFPYLPESVELVGVDVSEAMVRNARDELEGLPVEGSVQQMDAQSLAFPDDSFDTVISALSTCTFPDPIAALREMSRVCKPDGRILLLEHGRSGIGPIDRFLDWRADAHYRKRGCRWNQEPVELVREAGLPVVSARSDFFGMLTSVEATPDRDP